MDGFLIFNLILEPTLESYNQLIRAEYVKHWEKKKQIRESNGEFSSDPSKVSSAKSFPCYILTGNKDSSMTLPLKVHEWLAIP